MFAYFIAASKKTRLLKQGPLELNVPLLGINFHSSYMAKLYQQKSYPHVVKMLKISREIRAVKVNIYIKFNVIVRPRGHKQKKQINMVTQFPLLVFSKLNFNILRKVHWSQGLTKIEIHLALHNDDFILTILK